MSTLKFGDHTIKRIQILHRVGSTDTVHFEVAAPSPFPELSKSEPGMYAPVFRLEVRRGYAEQWLEAMFGIKDDDPIVEVIHA